MIYGLRTATEGEINQLKGKYPSGAHVTHKKSGCKLPYNGIFTVRVTGNLRKWARIDPCVYNPDLEITTKEEKK
jgi:hypothetical protein